jgi:hypothetical protein
MIVLVEIINKIKKTLIMSSIILIALGILSPYAADLYVKKQYDGFIKLAENLTPGIKITSHLQLKYFKSLLITKIQIANNAFLDYPNKHQGNIGNLINYIPHNTITLQHDIRYSPHKKLLATINTTVLDGLPKFMQQNKNAKLVTKVGFNGRIHSSIKDINMNHILNSARNHYLETRSVSFDLKHDRNNLSIVLKVPKLIYSEEQNKSEVDNLQFQVKAKDPAYQNNRRIHLLTAIDRLYVIEKSKPVLRLSNFNMEQNLGKTLINNLSFLRLNVLEYKFGPLATKLQLNNVNLSSLIKNFNHMRLPITKEQIDTYKFVELGNNFLKHQPNLSVDLLLHVGNDKLKVLSDIIVDTKNVDWFTTQDILDSLTASVTAKIPKPILLELVTFLERERQKKENQLQAIYKPNQRNPANLPKTFTSKDPKELHKQLENMVTEKVAYLIKNNIIKEHDDSFSLDLSIAEGTFYSRMNPFKIFSF